MNFKLADFNIYLKTKYVDIQTKCGEYFSSNEAWKIYFL